MATIKRSGVILLAITLFQSITLMAVNVDNGRQKRPISGFHGISVSSGIDVYLTQKDVEEVVVETGPNNFDKIVTKVEDGILKIYMKDKSWTSFNWRNEPRKVYVSFKTLDKLEASAGSDINSQSLLKLDNLEVNASSGSDITLELDANELNIETSSGSDISLRGKATVLNAGASSGSDIIANDLETKKCIASVSSGSDIKVKVTEELDADASSGGDIIYSGNPAKKNIHKSSGGDVHGR